MKITIETKAFKSAVKKLSNIATKGTLPILGDILFRSNTDSTVSMTAYDCETRHSIELPFACDDFSPFQFTLNCDKLIKLSSVMSSKDIKIYFDAITPNRVEIDFGTKVKLDSHNPEDFPSVCWNDMQVEGSLMLGFGCLQDAISHTMWSVAKSNEWSYAICGVCLDIDKQAGKVTAVGTDAKKMAVYTLTGSVCNIVAQSDYSDMAIVPLKACNQIAGFDGTCNVAISRKYVMVTGGGECIITKKIDKPYPKYKRVIPDNFDYTVMMDTEELCKDAKQIIKVGKTLGWVKEKPHVMFTFENDLVISHSSQPSTDIIEFEHVAKAEIYESDVPDGWQIKFDISFVEEILKSSDSECVMSFNEHQYDDNGKITSTPAMFKFTDNYFVILQPVQM